MYDFDRKMIEHVCDHFIASQNNAVNKLINGNTFSLSRLQVLPSLSEAPHLRSTDNGAILQSGGTISGRRPASILETSRTPHGHVVS